MHLNFAAAAAAFLLGSTVSAAPQILPPIRQKHKTPVRIGDGNPHQNYLYKQISNNQDCDNHECSISSSDVTIYSIGFSITGDPSGAGFINGGFSVSKSRSTGESASCGLPTDSDDQDICVFWRTAHTSYEVETYEHWHGDDPESGNKISGMWHFRSPNSDMNGDSYVCASGSDCTGKGHEFWGSSIENPDEIVSGGPGQRYPFDEAWK